MAFSFHRQRNLAKMRAAAIGGLKNAASGQPAGGFIVSASLGVSPSCWLSSSRHRLQ